MPNPTLALAILAAALIAAAAALDLPSASAQSEEQSGRIVARRLDDGRTEFGWQPTGAARVLPTNRYFPADVDHQRWLNSSPVEVGDAEIGRINARRTDDGRIEFAFTPTDGERILTDARYFPSRARANRWLRSTAITIGPPPPRYIAVSAGNGYTCGLPESGEIECWGWNHAGQIDAPEGSFIALDAAINNGWYACAIAETFEAVVQNTNTSGEIECWGSNSGGQISPPAGRFIAVSAGGAHACAIRATNDGTIEYAFGEIECWGNNFHLQVNPPTGRFIAVSAGGNHTCALRESREIECWGSLDGYWRYTNDAPSGRFTAVSTGVGHTCAIRESGEIACWGDNGSGQSDAPAGRFTAVSADGWYTCGLRTNGEIACWGDNRNGQSDAPAGSFATVSVGSFHACGLRESGVIACWGDNEWRQLDVPIP